MSDYFTRLPFVKLLEWIKGEENSEAMFGIHRDLFFRPSETDVFRIKRYGKVLETPIGVAAGPHTQLSQNIISAWLTGARYIELKTVQVLDELDVTKPCIDMEDIGFNCEWSQELKLEDSFDEYLNAFIVLFILKQRFDFSNSAGPGFLFNMSVGYNLEGVKSASVQKFLDKMVHSETLIRDKIVQVRHLFPEVQDIVFPRSISDNVTISTMHGCPPEEIEQIARYFIEERKLNTTIKLNPTLLGPEKVRDILNDRLGFDITVPDIAFDHDLKMEAGVILIQNLRDAAEKSGVEFNLKLTNTLETENRTDTLPEKERMVYMSGRALHAISINLASELQEQFDGTLDISFSAGADCYNVADILACGIKPITVCTDILKPGGYGRLAQYLTEINNRFGKKRAVDLTDFIAGTAESDSELRYQALDNLKKYAKKVLSEERYTKESFPWKNIKTARPLNPFDCIKAPCMETCPTGQDIPAYMRLTAQSNYDKALRVILETNPLPGIQGLVCDHPCSYKCTRINYDNPLLIREIKRFVSDKSEYIGLPEPLEDNGLYVAIIGAGPSGLSAACFLRLRGFAVTVFEEGKQAGGMATKAIPFYRLDDRRKNRDIERIMATGLTIKYLEKIDEIKFRELRDKYDYVYIAIGATAAVKLRVKGADAAGVFDQLTFLSAVKAHKEITIGRNIVVIGGGNSAMDAARTAKRLADDESKVTLLYRRTVKEMPADPDEVTAAACEGIKIRELISPESIVVEKGHIQKIRCFRMKLGKTDLSGRPRPEIIEGSLFEIETDMIITALGQQVVAPFFPGELQINPETRETLLDNVYAGGDAVRGASTLIRAIADGRFAAENIAKKAGIHIGSDFIKTLNNRNLALKKATRNYGVTIPETDLSERSGFDLVTRTLDEEQAITEARRCLSCDLICDVCVSVCPNRANVAYKSECFTTGIYNASQKNGKISLSKTDTFKINQGNQVLNIGDFCNECGNCATFCPTKGAPYKDKPKFYLDENNFNTEKSGYLLKGSVLIKKINGKMMSLTEHEKSYLFENDKVTVSLDKKCGEIVNVQFKTANDIETDLAALPELYFLLNTLKSVPGINTSALNQNR